MEEAEALYEAKVQIEVERLKALEPLGKQIRSSGFAQYETNPLVEFPDGNQLAQLKLKLFRLGIRKNPRPATSPLKMELIQRGILSGETKGRTIPVIKVGSATLKQIEPLPLMVLSASLMAGVLFGLFAVLLMESAQRGLQFPRKLSEVKI
jgi:hypothetical protein